MSETERVEEKLRNEFEKFIEDLYESDPELEESSAERVLAHLHSERIILNFRSVRLPETRQSPVLELTTTQPVDKDDSNGSTSSKTNSTIECPNCNEELTVSLST